MLSTEEQKGLYLKLRNTIDEKGDITAILRSATKDDLLGIFAEREEQEENANLLYNIIQEKNYRLAFFREVKEKGILQGLLNANLHVVKTGELVDDGTNTPDIDTEYKLADFIENSEVNIISLNEIKEVFGLKEFWKASSLNDHNIIKSALEKKRDNSDNEQEKSKYEGFLKEIEKIESEKDYSQVNTAKTDANHPVVESKPNSKAIVVGAIGGVIAGLAVGGGLFAAGAQLPILAIIGIAVAAAVLTGLIAGGITYTMLKPSESFNKVDLLEQVKLSEQIYSSLAV